MRTPTGRAVSRTVLRRLTRLSPDAVAVARAVAVLGDSSGLAAVGALSELPEAVGASWRPRSSPAERSRRVGASWRPRS
jgi:hypothetical protein